MTTQTHAVVDWRTEWFELDDVAYLNIAGQSPLPRAAIRAAQAAIEWKKYPHKMPEDVYFALPGRVREKIAALIGAAPGGNRAHYRSERGTRGGCQRL